MMAEPYFQIEGGAEKKRLDFPPGAAELFIGRSPECQFVIASGAVSRRHARLRYDGAEVTIEDLGSSNGTFVNGKRLNEPRALKDHDRVALGSVQLTFVMPAEARPEPSAMETLHDEPAATVFVPKPAAPAPEPPAAKPEPPETVAMPKPAAAPKPEERAPQTVYVPKPAAPPPPPPKPEPTAPETVFVPKPAAAPAEPKREETVFVPKPAAAPAAGAPDPAAPGTVYAPRPAPPSPPAEPRRPAMATVKPSVWSSEAAAAPEVKFIPAVAGPSVLELAVIALGSFLAVYAVGALLIRFVF